MDPMIFRNKHGPEYVIQREFTQFVRDRGWHVERVPGGTMVGGAVQSGLPDLFICHKKYGIRFVEMKNEVKYVFTTAQKWKFPLLMDNGCGIWVITGANDAQYEKLFCPPNLWDYLDRGECLNQGVLDKMLEELDSETD